MPEPETATERKKHAMGRVVALLAAVGMMVVGSLSGTPRLMSLGIAAILVLSVWVQWPRIEARLGGRQGVIWTLVAILAGTNLWTFKALNDLRVQLHDQKATTDTLRVRVNALTEDNRHLRDENTALNARVGERAEKESDEQARRSLVAEATRLEHVGQALLRRCCTEAGYAAVVPRALDSTITVWRHNVRSFVRRNSNPAFESVSYAEQTVQPEPRTQCIPVTGGAVDRPLWEIEQDLKELVAIRVANAR
jgi:regulator of replication initiation timing